MTDNTYQPAKVWTWDKSAGGAFANINRPVSGPTHEKTLPVGKHPLQLYSLGTPNGQKVTIMLEELLELGVTGAEYDAWLIRIGDGDQFSSGFVEVNPNSKIPALRDHTHNPPIRVFESGSILLYLAEIAVLTAAVFLAVRFLPGGGRPWNRLPESGTLAETLPELSKPQEESGEADASRPENETESGAEKEENWGDGQRSGLQPERIRAEGRGRTGGTAL